MSWPSAIGERSPSSGAPAAMVDWSGFICEISGQIDAAPAAAPAAPVAMKRKSRRGGLAQEDLLANQTSLAAGAERAANPEAGGRCPRGRKGGPRPRRREGAT